MSRPEPDIKKAYCPHGFPPLLCNSCSAQAPCMHGISGKCLLCTSLGFGWWSGQAVVGASAAGAGTEKLNDETRLLAALCYGEGSTKNVFEELAALANVFVRQAKARNKKSIADLVKSDPSYSFVVSDGNARYKKLKEASEEEIAKDAGMSTAVLAARNALDPAGKDYSNGAYFWDGKDIKTNYSAHPKVRAGIKFGDPNHNIYGIKENTKLVIVYWEKKDKKTGKMVNTKERGRYDHVYVSTAAWGGTIFWKYNPDFVSATGAKEYK